MEAYQRKQLAHVTWVRFQDSDNWIVHVPAAAQTHLLTASAHRLWTLIAEEGISQSTDLIARLANETDREADPAFVEAIADILSFMDSAGLIQPVRP